MKEALKVGGGCGTVGCAVGWMPTVFPRLTKWTQENVALREDETVVEYAVAERVFGLDYYESRGLFSPTWSNLGVRASPKQVAKHIRRFVKRRSR